MQSSLLVHVLQTFLQPCMRKLSTSHTKSLQKIAVFSIAIVGRKDIFINLDNDNGLLQIPDQQLRGSSSVKILI